MIKREAYLTAVPVATELKEKNIHIIAVDGSPLAELLDLSTSVVSVQTTDLPRVLANPNPRSDNQLFGDMERAGEVELVTSNFDGQSQHSLKVAALVDDIAPYVTSHISLARNTVVPIISELSNKLQKFVETARPIDPSSLFKINKRSLPALLQDESFMGDGLENYASSQHGWVNFNLCLDVVEDENFYLSLMNLSNERLNTLMGEWLRTLETDFLKNVFVVNFGSKIPTNGSASRYALSEPGASLDAYSAVDIALAVYIMGNRMLVDVQPTQGVPLAKYKGELRGVIDYAGTIIHKAMRTIKRQFESNVMVSRLVMSERSVTVNAALYDAWLESGGCPEVILGMVASGQVQYEVSAINEKKEELCRYWENYVMLSQTNIREELRKRFAAYAESEVLQGLNDLTELEKEYFTTHSNHLTKVAENVKAELAHFNHRLMDDIPHLALHLIARARFYFTSSYLILNEMVEVSKANPEIEPREAALLAVIAYITEYMTTQMRFVR
jgi:hypothetical protein